MSPERVALLKEIAEVGNRICDYLNRADTAIYNGGVDVDINEFKRLYDLYVKGGQKVYPRNVDSGDKRLTPRESQAVSLFNQGHKIREIAAAMSISEGTTKIHLKNARRNIGLPRRDHRRVSNDNTTA